MLIATVSLGLLIGHGVSRVYTYIRSIARVTISIADRFIATNGAKFEYVGAYAAGHTCFTDTNTPAPTSSATIIYTLEANADPLYAASTA